MKNKSHNHVHESRTFSKGRTWSKLTIALIRRTLTKIKNKLVFGHSSQTPTIKVVRMLYPQDVEHIGYNIRCDNYVRTSSTSNKKKY